MNRNLNLLLCGQLVSQIGDKFHMLAVAFMVLKSTGSPAKMGLVLFCSVFPGMILGIIAGALLDRYDRKWIIVAADAARGVLVSIMAILYMADALTFGILLTAQVLISVCTAFFDPAVPALIPQIVEKSKLTQANSKTQLMSGIAAIIGPMLGGLTVAWAGYLAAFLINAGSYLFSAVFECFIRLVDKPDRSGITSRIQDDIIEGCRFVYQRKTLMTILLIVAAIHFLVGAVEAVIPVLASALKGSGAENMGFIQTIFGLGTVVAAFAISYRGIAGRESRFLFGSVFCMGVLFFAIGAMFAWGLRTLFAFLFFFLCLGVLVVFAGTSFRTLIQKDVEERMLGRVFGLVSAVGNASIPLAILLAGLLMEYLPLESIMMACGLGLMPLAAGSWQIYNRAD